MLDKQDVLALADVLFTGVLFVVGLYVLGLVGVI
jgi:hypothetical protein